MEIEEKKIRYLEFIQNIITRMGECSFRCKEFSILLCTGLLTVYATVETHPIFIIYICGGVLMLFWFIDSFYLYKERQYRYLYNENKCISSNITEFNLSTDKSFSKYLLALTWSISTILFYLPLIVASIVFGVLISIGIL